jgi:hypothetical protein
MAKNPTSTKLTPPKGISTESKAIWLQITAGWRLDEYGLITLRTAIEAHERLLEARAAIKKDGAYIDGRFGKKAHPAMAVERDARAAFLRALRSLNLDVEFPHCRPGRPGGRGR